MSEAADIERIRSALAFIDAADRESWVRAGMAVKAGLGDAGFEIWDEWSRRADNYNAKAAAEVWKSIRSAGGVTLGSLFHQAKANGWRDEGGYQKPSPEELAAWRRRAKERAAAEAAEIEHERAETARKAAAVLKAAGAARADHPYLIKKQVAPVATLREIEAGEAAKIIGYVPKAGGEALAGRLLVVPVRRTGGELVTLELIDQPGRKAALAGRGSKSGGFWATARLPDGDGEGLTLLVGEGVATMLSASAAAGALGVASLAGGNLKPVATALRAKYPAAHLVVLADLVKVTGEPDPHSVEAARAVGGRLAVPHFGADREQNHKDFNDLAVVRGPAAVAECIAAAVPVAVAQGGGAGPGAPGDELGEDEPGMQDAPAGSIALVAHRLPEIINEMNEALLRSGAEIFERGGGVVHTFRTEKLRQLQGGAHLPEGSLVIEAVSPELLRLVATRDAVFVKYDARIGGWKRTDCPIQVARTFIEANGLRRLRPLRGVASCPLLRPDGSIVCEPGYDLQTGLYLSWDLGEIKPDRAGGLFAALKARELLEEMLSEFPFVGEVDRAVALAGILTAVMRPLLPSAPMIGVDASTPGTGKTTLVDVFGLVALGQPVPAITLAGANEEECEKRLGALLLSGVGALNLDNLSRPLQSDLLCQILTAASIRLRILGVSRAPSVSTSVFVAATGNNLCLVGDLSRRALVCRLDAGCERPDQRVFARNIGDYILERRKALVEAALTIVGNYQAAGRPDVGTAPFGSFDTWSETIRNALIWAGAADPCESRARIEELDPVRGELADVLPLWFARWRGEAVQVRDVIESAGLSQNDELRDVLLAIAANRRDPRQIDSRRLGHWLRRYRGRVVGGLRLDSDGASGTRARWRVIKI
ncbi:PriCT-2 domain-containing protein [Methylococcus geothermalis]|uniref:Primase C-terminal 2 domain-containing protein n=1 Tax=Methylococcus geothermalis TaxID=2681310 RepID=A0A858Q8N5_9GAMM|nr:PriCT-2 domain-containing protein [Methylococcus geothermalis]QJD30183.1 hypothetical protein GNH96_09510 [Methylococcus geothermalis]